MGTVLVACLAHARRYFIKAMLNDKDGCNQALSMFQALYEMERTAKELELSTDEIRMMREKEAVPLLTNFHDWLQKQYALPQPKSSFGKALFYCLNNWHELKQYTTNGALKIDNNHTEREMKYISMGKNSWLFYGSDQGGNPKNDFGVTLFRFAQRSEALAEIAMKPTGCYLPLRLVSRTTCSGACFGCQADSW